MAGVCAAGLFTVYLLTGGGGTRGEAMANRDVREALELMRHRRYEEALPGLKKSRSALALGWLAECHYHLGNDAEALAACDRLTQADPKDGRSEYVRGLVLLRQGKADRAKQHLDVAGRLGEPLAATVMKGGE